MRHRQAIEHLSDFGDGTLDPAIAAAVEAHVHGCPGCRDWLRTRDLLVGELTRDRKGVDDHPNSEFLALCVIRPEEIDEPDREEVQRHLARCSTCREELELTRAAVREARPRRSAPAAPPRRSVLPPRARALAAALGILALGALLYAATLLVGRAGLVDVRQVGGGAPPAPLRSGSMEELSGRELDGTHLIAADRELIVSNLSIKTGADVTFRANGVVVFGDGFSVANGARISVSSHRSESPLEAAGATSRKTNEASSNDPDRYRSFE